MNSPPCPSYIINLAKHVFPWYSLSHDVYFLRLLPEINTLMVKLYFVSSVETTYQILEKYLKHTLIHNSYFLGLQLLSLKLILLAYKLAG